MPGSSPDSDSTTAVDSKSHNRDEEDSRGNTPTHDRMPTASAFHTFKLVPMAPTTNARPSAPILPPAPVTPVSRPQSQPAMNNQPQNHENQNSTPTTESRMNPPPLPRSLVTPVREMREGSQISTSGGSARKPRQNLDERDHIAMLKACLDQKHNFKEGTKAQFWTGVNQAFQNDTGKVLAQMSATVGRLVEVRRRQISDWESGIIPNKPAGELNEKLDAWMEFLKIEDSDAEAERMRQVDARRKIEEQRKEARRQAIAAETLAHAQNNTGVRIVTGPAPPQEIQPLHQQQPQHIQPHIPPSQQQGPPSHSGEVTPHPLQQNGQPDMNGYRPQKRRRINERGTAQELQSQIHQEQWQAQQYALANPPEPPRRVVVEGAMTKEDWREVMGNDARLRTLETKVDRIELLLQQNNKLLHQLVQNQSANKDRDRNVEEERVPVHLDAEFERDYL
ncbi:hypothetical protein GLAREA_05157 [Glarea lozoyensis ATCC 20868]|uniref:Uncharacterized protein n=1 Tax=Glarea lozoyensis (strain ATCC 20868 / MF5171) TaxID=1116229 RepID=S3DFE9_GLAL2|nr:uncharacterized protein GLAREA_05157 [Glarea lozoyensis ATCC 20868]EPE35819.1 hypothetical protein GLAREA_05157 [Glarea lozoyensis ATCC 20868]